MPPGRASGAPRPGPSRAAAWLALAALSLVWGYSWVVAKIATRDASPLVVSTLRATLGAVALLGALAAMRRPLRPPPFLPTLVYGLLQTTAFTLVQTVAVSMGAAGRAAILAYTMPFWLALLAWRFLGVKLDRAHVVALVVAGAGLALIVGPESGSTRANLLAVLAGLVWAASSVWAMRVIAKTRHDLLSLSTWQMVWGAIVLAAVTVVVPGHVHWTPSFVASILFLAVGATALGWALWLFALSTLGPGPTGLGSLVVPVVGLVLAAVQLGEIPTGPELLGIACIVAALGIHWVAARAPRA